MEWLNGLKIETVLVVFVVVLLGMGGSAQADFTFGEPRMLRTPLSSSEIECFNCISADGLEMYIERPVPSDDLLSLDWDLYVSARATTSDPWPVPVSLGPTVNSSGYVDGSACLSSDGLELYFCSNREGDGQLDIWVTSRRRRDTDWGAPVKLGPSVNGPSSNLTPWISSDGLELYFSSNRAGGSGNVDLWVSQRASTHDAWGVPMNLGSVVNSRADDCSPCLSPDGLILFFCDSDNPSFVYRAGGHGQTDMWMTQRKSTADPWQRPVNLGPGLNTSYLESQPRISPDGSVLYFTSSRPGMGDVSDIWQAPILPIVDFNGDSLVDSTDMCIMVDYLDMDEPWYDIGPLPWGDGIVDVQDLLVLAEHLCEDIPLLE